MAGEATLPQISIIRNVWHEGKSDLPSCSGDLDPIIMDHPRCPVARHKRSFDNTQMCSSYTSPNPNNSFTSSACTNGTGPVITDNGDLANSVIESANSMMAPAASAAMADSTDEPVDEECATPKAQENRIMEPCECPPPPRKKPMKKSYFYGRRKFATSNCHDFTRPFFNPPAADLHTYPGCIQALFEQ